MKTLPEYALELERGEQMVSFDIQAGIRRFRLAPQMRDWFLFRYDGRFYRFLCAARDETCSAARTNAVLRVVMSMITVV
jgi:hypothetical protein